MMLVVVLCRFRLLIVKYFLKIEQRRSDFYSKSALVTSLNIWTTPMLGSWRDCRLDSKDWLKKAIVSCLNTGVATRLCQEVITNWYKLTLNLWGNFCLSSNQHLFS